ncbi:MAG: hypothetical protein AB2689_00550 [Candidatus Thiodiazotropha taylori]
MTNTEIMLNIGIPLSFVVVGAFAARLGRKDGDGTPAINHFAVGTTVLSMSLATILSDITINSAGNLEGNFIWATFYLLFIFVSIDIDRFSSWQRDEQGIPTNRKHVVRGIVIPNSFGVIAFCVYRFMV